MSRPLLPSEPTTALEGCLGRAGLKSLPAAEGAIIDPRVGIFYRCMYQETKGELARANRNASSTRLWMGVVAGLGAAVAYWAGSRRRG